ncbi:MAG: leucyl aminopeptidase [archaeon]
MKILGQHNSKAAVSFLLVFKDEPFPHYLLPLDKKLKEKCSGSFKEIYALENQRTYLVGMGEKKKCTTEHIRRIAGVITGVVRALKEKTYYVPLTALPFPEEESARAFAEGALFSLYAFDKYKKSAQEKKFFPDTCYLGTTKNITSVIDHAHILAENVIYVRDLVNEPAGVCTPSLLAAEAKALPLDVTVLGREQLQKLGMNGILAVSAGSAQEPKLITILYAPAKPKRTIALVGKGITFDAGGLDIKSTENMDTMKSDMHGAATVLGVMRALVQTKPNVRVIGVIAACENLLGERAYKPRDIIIAHNKKTIEICNTDAEGRVILADALSYTAKKYAPDSIIDIATLTGACIVALGKTTIGVMGNDEALINNILASARETDEDAWQLPLSDKYRELVESDTADVRNTGKDHPGAGAITAAAFLEQFTEGSAWAHLDIAGPAWTDKGNEYCPAGGTGCGVRLLAHLILSQ